MAIKARQRADPVAGERENDEADSGTDAAGCAKVGPERRLAVGARRDEVEPPARAEDAREQRRRRIAALVFKRNRRHRNEHIVGEQRDQRIQIA